MKPLQSLWARRVLATWLVLSVATGCSRAEPGNAVKAPGGLPPNTVDVNLLGSGNFPVKPTSPPGPAGSALQGALIDARRMADNVVGPWEIDAAMTLPSPSRAVVVSDVASLALIEPRAVADAAGPRNLIYGFSSDRQDPDGWRLMNAVLRFADPVSAADAAADMAKAATSQQPAVNRPVSIPGHPDARATTFSYNLDTSNDQPVTVYSFTPRGTYVLCQIAFADQLGAATTLVASTLDAQQPRIDQFAATAPEKFAGLAADPSGLLSHTMPAPTWPDPPDARPANPKIGIYLPRAALHFQDDPADTQIALTTAGVHGMSYNQTSVYLAGDGASADRLAHDLADIAMRSEPSARLFNGVDFMPGSQCVQFDREGSTTVSVYSCYASVNAYTIVVHDADPTGARQETAAQYKMLLAQ